MNQRDLTEEEQAELAELNAAVDAAIAARRDWLDAKMHETSKLKVGDGIYDVKNGMNVSPNRGYGLVLGRTLSATHSSVPHVSAQESSRG